MPGLPLSCPSGVAPEDQAPYICEAQNVFGKVQAEARLVVTGRGSLVDLETPGGGNAGYPQGGPPMSTHPLGQRCPLPGSPRGATGSPLPGRYTPGSVPFDPLGSPILMLPLVPSGGGESGDLHPLDDRPQGT